MRQSILVFAAVMSLSVGPWVHARSDGPSQSGTDVGRGAPTSGLAEVNGLKLHYEISGRGEPLLLLHGGLGLGDMFAPIVPAFAARRRVITVDLQGHGRTADVDRPIRYQTMADDVAALLTRLEIGAADVMGFSYGGSTALRLAIQHPRAVRRLVVVSSPFRQDGWFPEVLESQKGLDGSAADSMKETIMYRAYAAVAPEPGNFPLLLDKMGELMRQDYDWSTDVAALSMPVMLVYGDGDMVRPAHIVEFYRLLGGGRRDAGWMREHMPRNRLAILPNLTHYEIATAPVLVQTVLPFLDGYPSATN